MSQSTLFQHLATAAALAAPVLPGVAGTVAKFLSAAFGLGADLVAAGRDPVEQVTRIRERSPMLADVERGWEAEMLAKFGPREDIYED